MNGCRFYRFATYEAREKAFRRLAGGILPRHYGGPRVFWSDLHQAAREGLGSADAGLLARITANPRDCLAFGSAHQVLVAASMTGQAPGPATGRTADLARIFGIDHLLRQPIRTLSGGETVLVALAKAAALLPAARGLVIASPFTWLSRENQPYLETLLAYYDRHQAATTVLLLDGEDDDRPAPPPDLPAGPDFGLFFEGVKTPLSPSLGVAGRLPAMAAIGDSAIRLKSPCLIAGANGQGKSLLAKVLAGAVPFKGRVGLEAGGGPGTVRLLFQDVMTQTLLRDPAALAAAGAGPHKDDPLRMAAALEAEFEVRRKEAAEETATGPGAPSLRRVKTMLAATRLCTRPAALILDEPDWGLSRQDAIAWVQAVITAAHRQGTAVMLISHKSWWPAVCASTLRVFCQRDVTGPQTGLQIRLEGAAC